MESSVMTVAVITVSDRASRGEYADKSGPEIEKLILEAYSHASIIRTVVPDEQEAILKSFNKYEEADYILTTGGTGISARDVTPEVTKKWCERELPGVAEILRSESYRETPNAMFSRGFAGIKGNTIIVNFPGSVKAARFCTELLIPVMEHGISMIRGEGH